MTNAREVVQLTETLEEKLQAKSQRIGRYEKMEIQYIQKKMFSKDTKKIAGSWQEKYAGQKTPLYSNSRALLEVTVGRKSTA
jgi:hypothetical protein